MCTSLAVANIKTLLCCSLATLMSKEMSHSELDLENISVKNRPMTIMGEYSSFTSNEWLDAKTALDEREGPGGGGEGDEERKCREITRTMKVSLSI